MSGKLASSEDTVKQLVQYQATYNVEDLTPHKTVIKATVSPSLKAALELLSLS